MSVLPDTQIPTPLPSGASELEALLAHPPSPRGWPAADRQRILIQLLAAQLRECQQALQKPDHAAGLTLASQMLAAPPLVDPDPVTLRRAADLFHAAGLALFRAGLVAEAVPCQRRAIALYPCPTYSNNLINSLTLLREPSLLTDYCDTLAPEELAPHLLIACQPKSGSTFLKNVLCTVTGYQDVFLFHASGQSEQELFYPALLEFATVPTVTQQHCRATEANIQLLQAFGMRAVVLVRNLADTVVSLRDFYLQGAVLGTFFPADHWRTLPEAAQYDAIIDHIVPWHFQFLAGWQQADREQRVPVLWLTYEQLMADKPAALRRVLEFYGLPVDEARIAAALESLAGEKRLNRFNSGVSGRGGTRLSPQQHQRLRDLARAYPLTDCTPFGL